MNARERKKQRRNNPRLQQFKANAIRALYAAIAPLPLPVIQALGKGLGQMLWLSHSRMAQTTRKNIALCFPELDDRAQQQLAQRSVIATAQTILESGACWNWSQEKVMRHIRHVEGEALFADACRHPGGVIILLPHLSTWEMLNPVLAKYTHFTAMYKPPKIAPLDGWMRAVRERNNATLVPANRKGVTELLKALKNGGCVIVLPDQEPEASGGAFAPFFGIETLTVTLIHGLASRTDARVLLANIQRRPDGSGFNAVFREAPGVSDPDPRQSLTAMNAAIEQAVREIPEQYQWEYKRFKRRPDGHRSPYR